MIALIGLDWGTSALRAYAFSPDGEILDCAESAAGILSVVDGRFEAALRQTAASFLDAAPDAPVIASGMIGSRQGWVECPYVACPTSLHEICRQLSQRTLANNRKIYFVPGASIRDESGVPDVMRGEETQILGALDAHKASGPESSANEHDSAQGSCFVLPGTHSKWARIRHGSIDAFSTYMTGEVFQTLVEHTILGRMIENRTHHQAAFLRGVKYGGGAAENGVRGDGLLRKLFSARSLALFDQLGPNEVYSYLSGLLIGNEIADALRNADTDLPLGGPAPHPVDMATAEAPVKAGETLHLQRTVHIIGTGALTELYRDALANLGVQALPVPPHAAARGHWRIAQAANIG